MEFISVGCDDSSTVRACMLKNISMLKMDRSVGEVGFCRLPCWKEIQRSDRGMQSLYL